jgi:hypothetical protein
VLRIEGNHRCTAMNRNEMNTNDLCVAVGIRGFNLQFSMLVREGDS